MTTMSLGTISICMTVVVLNIHHRAPRFPVPPWLKTLMLYYIARLVCVQTHCRDVKKKDRAYAAKLDKIKISSAPSECKQNGGIGLLDEMETMGLTAVLNSRFPNNGPLKDNHVVPSSSMNSNISQTSGSASAGLKNRHRKFNRRKKSRESTPLDGDESTTDDDFSRDWHDFAHVLDRFFFWVVFILMTFSALIILLYPKYSGLEKEQLEVLRH